jgi:hypothetical protein
MVYALKFLFFALGLIIFKVSKTHYCGCTGNGEMIDDIKHHGSHDIFWCSSMREKYQVIWTSRQTRKAMR